MVDERCCGTGTCIINTEGFCWCGQQWNGNAMCFPESRPSQEFVVSRNDLSVNIARPSQPPSPLSDVDGLNTHERPAS